MRTGHAMKRIESKIALAFAAAMGCTIAAAQTWITPSTPGWGFVEETATGSGTFVNGPAVLALLSLLTASAGWLALRRRHAQTRLNVENARHR